MTRFVAGQVAPGVGTEANRAFRVFDLNGSILNSWNQPFGANFVFAELVKPMPNRGILATVFDWNLRFMTPHPKKLVELDWDGAVRWSYEPPKGMFIHHDFQRLANGNTLILTQTLRSVPSIKPGPIWDDAIIEINAQGSMLWSWSIADHAAQLPLTAQQWQILAATTGATVFHVNSIQSLPPNRWEAGDPRFRPGNILASVRNINMSLLIDKSTGNVLWTYQGTIAQHHSRLIPPGLPGAGNILIFDNGGTAGAPQVTRNYSRVIELDPITFQVVWSYECPTGCRVGDGDRGIGGGTSPTFFSVIMGASQRLSNGNTLITESTTGRLLEVTPGKAVVWEAFIGGTGYRSYRWPNSWFQGATQVPFVW